MPDLTPDPTPALWRRLQAAALTLPAAQADLALLLQEAAAALRADALRGAAENAVVMLVALTPEVPAAYRGRLAFVVSELVSALRYLRTGAGDVPGA